MTDYTLTSNKFLSEVELEHLTGTLHRFADRDPRNTLIIFLLLNSGARPSEILNLRFCDVDPTNRSIFIRGVKGSRNRDMPLPNWLYERLESYMSEFPEHKHGDRIFPIAYNTLGHIWRQYRPCAKSLRSTRHTFAVHIFRKSKDPRIVQKMLGHKFLQTTEIYLDFDYSQNEFRRLIGD